MGESTEDYDDSIFDENLDNDVADGPVKPGKGPIDDTPDMHEPLQEDTSAMAEALARAEAEMDGMRAQYESKVANLTAELRKVKEGDVIAQERDKLRCVSV